MYSKRQQKMKFMRLNVNGDRHPQAHAGHRTYTFQWNKLQPCTFLIPSFRSSSLRLCQAMLAKQWANAVLSISYLIDKHEKQKKINRFNMWKLHLTIAMLHTWANPHCKLILWKVFMSAMAQGYVENFEFVLQYKWHWIRNFLTGINERCSMSPWL